MIRPERIGVEAHGASGENRLPGLVERAVFLGNSFELHVRVLGGDLLKATVPNDGSGIPFDEGTAVTLHLPPEALLPWAPGGCRGRVDPRLPSGATRRAGCRSAAAPPRPVRTAPSMYPATHWSEPHT